MGLIAPNRNRFGNELFTHWLVIFCCCSRKKKRSHHCSIADSSRHFIRMSKEQENVKQFFYLTIFDNMKICRGRRTWTQMLGSIITVFVFSLVNSTSMSSNVSLLDHMIPQCIISSFNHILFWWQVLSQGRCEPTTDCVFILFPCLWEANYWQVLNIIDFIMNWKRK